MAFYLNEFRHFIELPTTPDIIGKISVKENSSLTLWCHSESTSLPPDYRYLSNMEYYWSGVYNWTGSNITTGLLSREQNRISPSVSITTSNSSEIVETDNMTFSFNVTSNPVSDIKLYNMTDNNTLFTWNDANKGEYQFLNVHCLDTGEYMFTAKNDIPDEHYIMKNTAYIEVMCAPRKSYQFSESGVQGVSLGDSCTLEVGVLSNPYPLVTSQNWTFVDFNGSLHDNLPDNVNVSVHPGVERLTILIRLILTDVKSINYGNYSLMAGNNHGNMTPVTLRIMPEVKAVFTKDLEITIAEGRAEIHFIIFGPLTHILEENCVKDTAICDKVNITVPTEKHVRPSQVTVVHDFIVNVPLAYSEET
ncbi:hypothetical protein LSH36_1518g00015 [Paralvinella palmiformis]|uniref:Immunoglobulin domain-containing protein n=1 Tax=Paralvinella palmiformis TaxID=53620 RepID=A0AAD9MQH2_9ANNE|nr:hypothetical protein LSH36_1518g00015 [Paralvinella palmiformis]